MRGSPLFRTILVAMTLVLAAVGLSRLTMAAGRDTGPAAATSAESPVEPVATVSTPFQLVLSAPAAEVSVATGRDEQVFHSVADPLRGSLPIDPANPQVFLVVKWQSPAPAGEHRFAKIVLEQPGRPTLTRFVDAPGDIDEILELPIP